MARSFVSILIDTYNHERFIEQAITSVLEQDFPASEQEIIVVDDGSTDGTSELVRKFRPRIRLLRKPNGGQASAFNVGIPQCSGAIVAFLDGDDWWAPDKLSKVVDAFHSSPADGLIGHGITEVYEDGREHTELLTEFPRFRIDSTRGAKLFRLRKSFLGTSRMAYRADLLRGLLPVPPGLRIEADEYLFTLAACRSSVMILREALTFYRLHAGNLYQTQHFLPEAVRRKQQILNTLMCALRDAMPRCGAPPDAIQVVLEVLAAEIDQIRLTLDGGPPWRTIRTEWAIYRIMHEHAPWSHRLFRMLTILPALMIPPVVFYGIRRRLAESEWYRRGRRFISPSPQFPHVGRSWKSRE
jgi:GT2 family glycosyltransferase